MAKTGPLVHLGDLVGLSGFASILGVRRSTVRTWKTRGQLPKPVAEIDGWYPVWLRGQVEEWRLERGLEAAREEAFQSQKGRQGTA